MEDKHRGPITLGYPVSVPMGECRTAFLPCKKGRQQNTKNLAVFVIDAGTFVDIHPENINDFLDAATNVVTFEFKNKTSINTFIKILEKFRDNDYGRKFEED